MQPPNRKFTAQYQVFRGSVPWVDLEGGGEFLGLQPPPTPPPPNDQKYSIEYSTTEVPSHVGALVYIAKSLVVVVVNSKQVVKPLTRLAVVLHLLECLLEHRHSTM